MTQRPRLFRLIPFLPILATVSLAEPATAQIPETGPGSGWVLTPPFFPRGALITLIAGNPNAPGPLQVELIYPNGYRIGPHFHPADLHVQVKAGTMQVGVGDRAKWNAVRNLEVEIPPLSQRGLATTIGRRARRGSPSRRPARSS